MKRLITLAGLLLVAVLAQAQYTVKKIDINKTGPAAGGEPQGYVEYQGRAYFYATDGVHGRELWWSDGDDAGMVADLNTGSADGMSYVSDLCVVKDMLYFSAHDGQNPYTLWSFNGKDPVAPAVGQLFGYPLGLTELNDKLYFLARATNVTRQLYEFDPDSAWYFKADTIPGTAGWYEFYQTPVVFKGRILYHAQMDTAIGRELYQYMPGQGFSLVADIFPGSGSSYPKNMLVLGDKLYFQAVDPLHGHELYMWDGVNPVQRVTDIIQGTDHSFPYQQFVTHDGSEMIGYHGKLYFSARSKKNVPYPAPPLYDLYSYDPANGTLKVVRPDVFARDMVVYAANLYFTGADTLNAGTTFMYNDLLGGGDFGAQFVPRLVMSKPAVINSKLFFSSNEPYGSDELYVFTDARALGMTEVPKANNVTVYPNPAGDKTTISCTLKQPATLHAQVTDMQGRVVYTTGMKNYPSGIHQITMPVQQLAAGNYIYSVMNDSGDILGSGKLVKE